MPARCQICTSPYLQQISDLIDSNTLTLKQIAVQFSVSVFSLSRHCARHRRPAEPASEATSNDIQIWLDRCHAQYEAAVFDNDARAAIQTLAQGLRACEARQKQLEREREEVAQEAGEDGDFRFSISDLDGVNLLLSQTEPDPVDVPKIEEALKRCRLLNLPDGMVIFHRMIESPAFAQDLLRWAALWEPTKKGEAANESEFIPQATAPN